MNRISRSTVQVLTALLLLPPIVQAQATDTESRIRDCTRFAHNPTRLECYDELAKSLASGETGESAITEEAEAPPEPAPAEHSAPSVAGAAAASTKRSVKQDEESVAIPVTVVSCRRLVDDDYLFALDNGEYWQQAGGHRLRLSGCSFGATIQKDFFGYKMVFDEDGRTVRVKRVK